MMRISEVTLSFGTACLWAFLSLAIFGSLFTPLALALCAGRRAVPIQGECSSREISQWTSLVEALADEGVACDVGSLDEAAKTGKSRLVRLLAIELLGRTGISESSQTLQDILENISEDVFLRDASALALLHLGDRRGVEWLKDSMRNSENEIHQADIAANLARFGDSDGYPYVVSLAKISDATLRRLSIPPLIAFWSQTSASSGLTPAPDNLLLELSEDSSSEVRHSWVRDLAVNDDVRDDRVVARRFGGRLARMRQEDPDPSIREDIELYFGDELREFQASEERNLFSNELQP